MPTDRRRRPVARAAVAAAAWAGIALGSGCAIQPDNAPREIPVAERGQLDPVPPGGEAIGQSRIYLVSGDGEGGGRELRSVLRDVDPPTREEVMRTLIAGPNPGEADAGMSSALLSSTTVHSAPLVASTLTVDISAEILELPGSTLREAVAQIVFTGSELDGVRSVRILVDGANQPWPDGSGELQDRPLTVYDYPGLAESAQPPYPPVPSENPE
jgi:hypothetical protein